MASAIVCRDDVHDVGKLYQAGRPGRLRASGLFYDIEDTDL